MTASRSHVNRGHLIEAARRVFAEQGVSAEVKDIAARAGVGIGTFYRNFPSKDDLVRALLDEANELTDASFDEAAAGQRSGLARLTLILTRLFEAEQRYGWLIEAAWTGQLRPEWLSREREEGRRELFHAFLAQCMDEDVLPPGTDPDLITAMLMGPMLLRSRLELRLAPQEAAETLLRIVIFGAGRRD